MAELVPLVLQLGGLVAWFGHARARVTMARAYVLRTAFGLVLIVIAMLGAGILVVGAELGLAMLACFCLISLVWMAFNCWALLFAIADAERADERRAADAAEPARPVDVLR